MAMLEVGNYHDFVKSQREMGVQPRRMYGDLLPLVAVSHPRELASKTVAQNRTVQRAMERQLKSYYLQKRRAVMQLERETNDLYKKALKRHKVLKLSERKRRLEEEEEAKNRQVLDDSLSTISSSQGALPRKTSQVIEVARGSKSSNPFGFRRGRDREVSEISGTDESSVAETISPELEEETEKPLATGLKSVQEPKDAVRKTKSKKKSKRERSKDNDESVLPALKVPPRPKQPEKRIMSTLVPIPEDDALSKLRNGLIDDNQRASPRSKSSDQSQSKPRRRAKIQPTFHLPSLAEFCPPSPTVTEKKPSSDRRNYERPWRNNAAKELSNVPPLVPGVSEYTDWVKRNGTYVATKMVFTEPELRYFTYEPLIQRKQRINKTSHALHDLVSDRLPNFYGSTVDNPSPTSSQNDSEW